MQPQAPNYMKAATFGLAAASIWPARAQLRGSGSLRAPKQRTLLRRQRHPPCARSRTNRGLMIRRYVLFPIRGPGLESDRPRLGTRHRRSASFGAEFSHGRQIRSPLCFLCGNWRVSAGAWSSLLRARCCLQDPLNENPKHLSGSRQLDQLLTHQPSVGLVGGAGPVLRCDDCRFAQYRAA